MTYSEACTRFTNLATTGISIEDAIIEAVDRIYEMGRFPGTTVEIALTEADFELDADVNAYFLFFDDETYDGAIGFRSDGRGWSIVDQTVLYKDGINAGDKEFVDYGTVDYQNGNLVISGTLTDGSSSFVFPEMPPTSTSILDEVERIVYESGEFAANSSYYSVSYSNSTNGWIVYYSFNELDSAEWRSGPGVELTPIGLTYATVGNDTGVPVVSFSTSKKRKYRAPLGFAPDQGPYYALMKLDAPELTDDVIIQVPIGPLKCAILAVCQEYVNDDERAILNWQKFEQFMTRSERQVHGPKRWTIGMDCSLRRRPSQFS